MQKQTESTDMHTYVYFSFIPAGPPDPHHWAAHTVPSAPEHHNQDRDQDHDHRHNKHGPNHTKMPCTKPVRILTTRRRT